MAASLEGLRKVLKVTKLEFSYTWTIEKFSDLDSEVGACVKSQRFSATGNLQDQWWIKCYPGGEEQDYQGHVSVNLHSAVHINAKITLSIINRCGERVNLEEMTPVHHLPQAGWGLGKFVSRQWLLSQAESLLAGDALRLDCQICTAEGCRFLADSKLAKDLEQMLIRPEFSDVTLVAGGKEMPAHRGILASRSTVFARMLATEMQESQAKRILIEDASHEAVYEMLYYMYTGTSPRLRQLSQQLIYLAEKYHLVELKEMCQEAIVKGFTIDNCVEVLVLSDRLCSQVIKQTALDYITDNIEEVMKTDEWNHLVASNGPFVNDVLTSYLKKFPQNINS